MKKSNLLVGTLTAIAAGLTACAPETPQSIHGIVTDASMNDILVVTDQGDTVAISTMDAAIAKLSAIRSGIGAYTNRLEYASSSLAETQEDMTTAYSGLMDTDMASEMTEYTQQNILEQAAVSVLSQANDIPQQVLSLLQK